MDVFAEMKQLCQELLDCEGHEVTPQTRFLEDLHIDSLGVIEMAVGAEMLFAVDLPDGEYDHVRTVQDAVDYVSSKLGK